MKSCAVLLFFLLCAVPALAVPRHVYLTWQGDPSTTMTVNYHTAGEVLSQVFYDTLARGGLLETYAFRAVGTSHRISGADERRIHWVELRDLEPGRTYFFAVADGDSARAERKFRTAPADGRPLRFVTGGDMDVGERARLLLAQAARTEPLFALLGGDLAYADGERDEYGKWDRWLENWTEEMVTPQGYTVPLVTAIGNHEVDGGYGGRPEDAPFFFRYFAQAGDSSYFARRFGEQMVVYVLDSGHIHSPGGAQAAWLEAEMEKTRQTPWRFALYHVPLYPSYRTYDHHHSEELRAHWLPLFDRFALSAAFENHDHMLKRSRRLRGDRPDEGGTLYLGDGCFGKKPRSAWFRWIRRVFTDTVGRKRRWYLAHSASVAHFWLVQVQARQTLFQAIDPRGRVVDEYALPLVGGAP